MIFNINNKKGQAMLWIIVSIGLFAFLAIIFFIITKPIPPTVIENNFEGSIDSCIREITEEAVDKMIPSGGFINPQNNRVYNNVKVTYLCQNIGYYKPCVNQHPLYLTEIKNEIYNYIFPVAKDCIDSAIAIYQEKGYNVSSGNANMSVELSNDLILIDIEKEINLQKEDIAQRFNNFEIRIKSPIYDLAKVANEISNQEAKYCYFEYLGYSILYPRFSIRRFVFSDSTEIYSIMDQDSKKEMNIAVRGCAIPPGI